MKAVRFCRSSTGCQANSAALFLISNESSYANPRTLFLDGGRDLAGLECVFRMAGGLPRRFVMHT
jgi:hypothetical protein